VGWLIGALTVVVAAVVVLVDELRHVKSHGGFKHCVTSQLCPTGHPSVLQSAAVGSEVGCGVGGEVGQVG